MTTDEPGTDRRVGKVDRARNRIRQLCTSPCLNFGSNLRTESFPRSRCGTSTPCQVRWRAVLRVLLAFGIACLIPARIDGLAVSTDQIRQRSGRLRYHPLGVRPNRGIMIATFKLHGSTEPQQIFRPQLIDEAAFGPDGPKQAGDRPYASASVRHAAEYTRLLHPLRVSDKHGMLWPVTDSDAKDESIPKSVMAELTDGLLILFRTKNNRVDYSIMNRPANVVALDDHMLATAIVYAGSHFPVEKQRGLHSKPTDRETVEREDGRRVTYKESIDIDWEARRIVSSKGRDLTLNVLRIVVENLMAAAHKAASRRNWNQTKDLN